MITTMVQLISLMFILITYYWIYMLESMSSTQKRKQQWIGTIWNTECKHRIHKLIEDESDCLERDWFSVLYRPVLLWLSWSITVPNQSHHNNWSLSYGGDRIPISNLWSKSVFLIFSRELLDNSTRQEWSRGYHYQTEYLLFIAVNIISVWLFWMIFIPITYQLFLLCFILCSPHKIWNNPLKCIDHFIRCCYFIYLFYNGNGQGSA